MSARSFLVSTITASAAVIVALNLAAREPRPASDLLETLPPAPAATEPPAFRADLRRPSLSEVVDAVYRAFPHALPVGALAPSGAVAGDFNGDGSPDLAVPARALRAQTAALNDAFANWIVQEPAGAPPAGGAAVVLHEGDAVLAIVHGIGGPGWRHPEARQSYLLKVSLGGTLEVRRRETLRRAHETVRLRGDLLWETGGRRFLYWTGARYAWHAARPV
jgi:hypothetical protein